MSQAWNLVIAGCVVLGIASPAAAADEAAKPSAEPSAADSPWKVNKPIVSVQKELYKKHPKPRTAALAIVHYVGPKLERREHQAFETLDDVWDENRARWSSDNGRTWSDWVAGQPSTNVKYGDVTVWEGDGSSVFDPAAGVLVQLWLRQIQQKGIVHNFTYTRFSRDFGRTWSAARLLRYEAGDDFDPKEPLKSTYLNHNEGYPGSNILVRRDGTLVASLAHSNAAGDAKNNERPWRLGSILFLGKWDSARGDYDWKPAARVETSTDASARGLMEPEVAELKDGRLLVVWRTSTDSWGEPTKAKMPGRKFFSASSDGGRTLTAPAEWKYADGSSFYSPSSFHRMIRHSVTGKLYWLGNICPTPPRGNLPRHPLIIAEVDEAKAALKKETVTAIDDKQPGQGDFQLSNFSLLEDRENHKLELHLTTYGQEPDPKDWATADNYKYVLTLK